jgi:hypothetical protein
MPETDSKPVVESLSEMKTDVEETLGVDVEVVWVDELGVVRARIANIDPAVWRCCGDPTFGVDRARAEDVRIVDGRFNEQLPDRWIDINFGQLFACGGPVSTSVNN